MALTKITSRVISANAAANNIGYVPANKAGDTFTGNVAIGSGTFTSTFDVTGAQFNANTVGGYSTTSLRYNGAPAANSYGPGLTFSQYWYNASTSSITTGAIAGVKTQGDGNFGGGLAFFSGGAGASAVTERMRIDDAGRITTPYQPAFRAYLSTEWTTTGVPNSGWTEFFDRGNNFNQGTFTAPVAGVYKFGVLWDANGSATSAAIRQNGNAVAAFEPSYADGWESNQLHVLVNMAANDYVALNISTASGANPFHMGGGYWGYFYGYLVG